jgi:UDP-GlcNAc:undecaprenyl-phosphate GlcNAc-1-phosphate transferase
MLIDYLFIFLLSFLASFVGTRLCRFLAHCLGVVDHPDNSVKTHAVPTAYMGGVGIWIGFLSGFLWVWINKSDWLYELGSWPGWIVTASIVICIVGLIDDLRNISPFQKVLGQSLAAVIAAAAIKPIVHEAFPDLPSWISVSVAFGLLLFFVLGASNSINLLDGLDGLCGGVTVFIAIGFFILSRLVQSPFSSIQAVLALSLAGAAGGFLVFNYPPASIFMGDAGSLLIGLLLACQMILFLLGGSAAFLASLFIFGLPILDTSVAILRRLLNKKPLFVSDRGHIYDQFVDRGMSKKQSIWACWCMTAASSAIGLTGYKIGFKFALPLYFITLLLTFLIIWKKGFLKKV